MTDEQLNITDFSSNIYQMAGFTEEKVQKNLEMTGFIENFTNLIPECQEIYDDIITDGRTSDYVMTGFANRIAIFQNQFQIDYQQDQNSTLNNSQSLQRFPCVINFVRKPLVTFNFNIVMNIWLVLPLHKHPDCDSLLLNILLPFYLAPTQHSQPIQGNTPNQKMSFEKLMEPKSPVFRAPSNLGLIPGQSRLGALTLVEIQEHLLAPKFSSAIDSRNRISLRDSNNASLERTLEFEIHSQSSKSSSGASDNSTYYAKSLLLRKRTPRILKFNLALLFLMILTFVIASIFNLVIFLEKHQLIQGRMIAFNLIKERNSLVRALMLNLKTLQLIAWDPKALNQSNALPKEVSRLNFYAQNTQDISNLIDSIMKEYDSFVTLNREYISFNFEVNQLQFLSNQGHIYNINDMKLSQALNTLVQYANDINITELLHQRPPLNVTSYARNFSSPSNMLNQNFTNSTVITPLQRSLFFLFQNGLYHLFEVQYQQYFYILKESQRQTKESIATLNLTTFLSIGLVALICFSILPLLTRVSNSILYPVKVINSLDRKLMEAQHTATKDYIVQIEKVKIKQKLRYDFQIFRGEEIKQGQFQLSQSLNIGLLTNLFKNRSQKKSDKEISLFMSKDEIKLSFDQNQYNNPHSNDTEKKQSSSKLNKTLSMIPKFEKKSTSQVGKNVKFLKEQDRTKLYVIKEETHKDQSKKGSDNNESRQIKILPENQSVSFTGSSEESDLEEKKNVKLNFRRASKGTNQRRISYSEKYNNSSKRLYECDEKDSNKQTQRKIKRRKEKEIIDQDLQAKDVTSQSNDSMVSQNHLKDQLKQISLKLKLIYFLITIILSVYFTSSFMVSYFMSQQVFQSDEDGVQQFQVFSYREICEYGLLYSLREKALLNHSSYLYFIQQGGILQAYQTDSVFYNSATSQEQLIAQLQNNPPVYLENFIPTLDEIESNQMCNITFYNSNPTKAMDCEKAFNSLQSRGLGNSLQYLFSQYQQLNLNFDNTKSRSISYLYSIQSNQMMQDLTDMALYYHREIHSFLQKAQKDSALTYFKNAKANYIMAFDIYLALTILVCILLGYFLYKKSKRQLLQMQNLLILLPFENIDLQLKQQVEKYINNN